MKKIINSKLFYFIIIFLFMFIFNCMTSYIQDDYWYMYDYNRSDRIKNLIDILVNIKNMYFTWGGRVFAHFFAYTFLLLPKWIFNIVNSVVYVLNIYLIYLISRGKRKDNYKYLLFIHMTMFIFFPVFGQVFLWLDGSCNYSFTLCVQLFFIYKILNIKNKNNYFVYVIISLLAGMCNENSSLSLIAFLILYIIYDRSNLKLKAVSLISLIIGYLFMFLAPGNYIRLNHQGDNSLFSNIIPRFSYLIINFWPIILGVLLIVIVFIRKNKKDGKLCLIYYLSSLVAFFSMMASPQLLVRSFTMSFIYILLILLIIFFNINKDIIKKSIYIIISILFILVVIPTTKDYINYYKFMNNRYKLIEEAKKSNKEEIAVEKYKENGNCRIPIGCDVPDVYDDFYDFATNYFISKYYGIKVYGYK